LFIKAFDRMDIIDAIDRAARNFPEKLAHISDVRTLTYSELGKQSDALAAHFMERYPGDKSPVAIIGHKEPEMLIGFLAAVKSGRPYVPIDVSIPPHRANRIIQSSRAIAALTPPQIAALAGEHSSGKPTRLDRDDPFYIIYTSGSTGEPKGVVITMQCLSTFLDWMLEEQELIEAAETFLNQAPFSFDLSVMDLYLSLATAGTLFSIGKEEIANLKKLYAEFKRSAITTWVSTPTFGQMCLVERGFAQAMLPQLRRFLFCGETLAPETASQLLERFPNAEVWNTYGPTEATVACASVRVTRDVLAQYSPLPVGRPMPGAKIFIAGADAEPVTAGDRGEIIIAGANVSPGYLGQPDLTNSSFFRLGNLRAYRTGDWGRIQDDFLFFEGRIDRQVKVYGYRIELGDLEENLRALPAVADAVVLPVIRNGVAESLAAFVVLVQRGQETDFELATRLRALLAERLPVYMLPRKILFYDAFPITANGKTDRRSLSASIA
jgi:D-alanine--poly(phosphoribitol) ligase subunit 1